MGRGTLVPAAEKYNAQKGYKPDISRKYTLKANSTTGGPRFSVAGEYRGPEIRQRGPGTVLVTRRGCKVRGQTFHTE